MSTETERSYLIDRFKKEVPKTAALAGVGHEGAFRELEARAYGHEVTPQAEAACAKLRGRNISWISIFVSTCSCARGAKSLKARVILYRIADLAESRITNEF
jgi:hypothetical protein